MTITVGCASSRWVRSSVAQSKPGIFAASWLVSVAIYKVRGYDRIEVTVRE